MNETARKVGRVKWYNDQRGYGFINVPGSIYDYFLHVSELRKAKVGGPIIEGEEMSFTPDQGDKGMRATNVERVKGA